MAAVTSYENRESVGVGILWDSANKFFLVKKGKLKRISSDDFHDYLVAFYLSVPCCC